MPATHAAVPLISRIAGVSNGKLSELPRTGYFRRPDVDSRGAFGYKYANFLSGMRLPLFPVTWESRL
jgi:hypothetical protein